jgi:MFS family permease
VIRRSRAVSVIFGVSAATAVGEGIMGVMFLIWIKKVIDGGAPELGWFMSAQAIGGVLGGLAAGWFARRLPPERLYGWGLLTFGLIDLALFNYPLAFSGVLIGLVLIAVVGIPGVASNAARQTLIQADVEDRYRGRVFGALGTTAAALMLVATFVAGAIGEAVGPIAMLNVQGGAYVVSGIAVLLLLTPAVNAARRPTAASREAEIA